MKTISSSIRFIINFTTINTNIVLYTYTVYYNFRKLVGLMEYAPMKKTGFQFRNIEKNSVIKKHRLDTKCLMYVRTCTGMCNQIADLRANY